MVKRLGIALAGAAVAYAVAAAAGYFLVLQLTGNQHDRELEAAMTAFFVCGPIGAVLAFAAGLLRRGAQSSVTSRR